MVQTKRQITILTDLELITCIVQKGCADDIVKAAYEAGAQSFGSAAAGCKTHRQALALLGKKA